MEIPANPSNTEAFEDDALPLIRRIFGNPGYDTKYNISATDTRAISSKWSIAHWRVHTHWRIAHWRVASWKGNNDSAIMEAPCDADLDAIGKVTLASNVRLRDEAFGQLVFIQGDVFALNKAGAAILEYVLEKENIDDYDGEISTEIYQDFISDLLSLGIIEIV